jgi:DNA-binding transcriptional LysR family regulator
VFDVELRHLATMAAIVEEGTFGRAGSRLGYTQSSISQQIAALEKSVGGPVFERPGGPKPVRITPLGAVVLEHGRDLLAKAEALADAVERFKAGDGRIDVGTRLALHELRPAPTRGIYLHWPARSSQSPLAVRAIEVAAEVAAEVSADLVKQ